MKLILLSVAFFVVLIFSVAPITAQRGLPTPPGALLQSYHYHRATATATRTLVPTKTSTPPPTATKRPTAATAPLAQCDLVKLGTQYGTPMAQWSCYDQYGHFQAWVPATVTPDWP